MYLAIGEGDTKMTTKQKSIISTYQAMSYKERKEVIDELRRLSEKETIEENRLIESKEKK